MRKITAEAVNAFIEGRHYKKSNMEVRDNCMYLHNNKIAWFDRNHQLWISNCGWWSNTTKERLNALPSVRIIQRNYHWYLNGVDWDGSPKCIGRVN